MSDQHRLTIQIKPEGDRFIAVPYWQRVEMAPGYSDRIAEGETEDDCLIAVEDWIAQIPIYPVPRPVHPKHPAKRRAGS